MEFITCKEDTDARSRTSTSRSPSPTTFMEAVKAGGELRPDPSQDRQGRRPARRARGLGQDHPRRLETGEPGVFFIDEANHYNPVPHLGAYEATNPCGEQPLLPYDVCNLGSINVGLLRRRTAQMDWDALRADIHLSHALPRQRHRRQPVSAAGDRPTWRKRIRRIGLGVMGFADAVRASSASPTTPTKAWTFGRKVHGVRGRRGQDASRERLADERGPFPEWEQSIWGPDETCARDAERQAHPPDAAAAQLQRHHRRADGHDLDHRRLQLGHRAAVRRRVHAQPGRRADARRERGLRRDREGARAGTPTS